MASLLLHTIPDVPIVVFDDAGPSAAAVGQLEALEIELGREVHYFRQPINLGVVGNLNTAFRMLAPADVIVLNSDIIVGPEWAERLIAAGRSRTDIATATALSANASIFTVRGPESWLRQTPSVSEFAQVATKVAEMSRQTYPFVPVATSFCTFFARRALNVVGGLDEEFSPGYGEEVDYSLRCVSYGFSHIAVDDVYVFHATGESFGEVALNQRKVDNDLLVSRRFPFWDDWIAHFQSTDDTPLARARHYTSAVIHGMVVAIDAELIHESLTGTFEVSLALSRQLALHPQVHRVIWVAAPERVRPLRGLLKSLSIDTIDVETLADLRSAGDFLDVAFRPYQDYSGQTWPQVSAAAHRNVIWSLDLIATLNPHYAADFPDFLRLTDVVERSWHNADAIAVLTPHVKETLVSFYIGGDSTADVFVLPVGSPEQLARRTTTWNVENSGIDDLGDAPYVLVLGTNFLHKNVPWLMRVGLRLKSLGWPGVFVFAGPTPTRGHSEQLETDVIELSGADCFIFLGRVSDNDRSRLLEGAALVVSPSVTEGWGMVPAEAVALGTTPITTQGGGLRDILPDGAEFLGLADDQTDAETLLGLLSDSDRSNRQREAWQSKSQEFQWSSSAQILIDAFMQTFLHRRKQHGPAAAPDTRRPITIRMVNASVKLLPVGSRPRRVLKRLLGRFLP